MLTASQSPQYCFQSSDYTFFPILNAGEGMSGNALQILPQTPVTSVRLSFIEGGIYNFVPTKGHL